MVIAQAAVGCDVKILSCRLIYRKIHLLAMPSISLALMGSARYALALKSSEGLQVLIEDISCAFENRRSRDFEFACCFQEFKGVSGLCDDPVASGLPYRALLPLLYTNDTYDR